MKWIYCDENDSSGSFFNFLPQVQMNWLRLILSRPAVLKLENINLKSYLQGYKDDKKNGSYQMAFKFPVYNGD